MSGLPRIRVRALMYHDVVRGAFDDSGFRGSAAARYKLRWDVFVAHLDAIGRSGDPPATARELLAPSAGREPWALTFDDGGTSALDVGRDLLRRDWLGHFFVTTGLIGRPGFLDAADVRELHAMGHLIGSHTATHPSPMRRLSDAELLQEWRASIAALSDLLGRQVTLASVAGGGYSARVGAAAERAGIALLFTSEPVRAARHAGDCVVVGRYHVHQDTDAEAAARAAAGDRLPWARQYVAWNLRKPLRLVGGERYEQVRSGILTARAERVRGR